MSIFWIAVVLFAVWFATRYLRVKVNKSSGIKDARSPAASATPAPPNASPSDCDEVEIKGESNYQPALIANFGPYTEEGHSEYCGAELVCEPSNPYDKNAVRCEIGGLLVGYVNKSEAKTISAHLRKKKQTTLQVNASVRGGWQRSRGDQGNYGVSVEIAPGILDA
ncbi:MAG: hypothetical protein A3I66_00735 [Burkholderiales bacterium RIFCSPLOWO2_02_FULL_57_36]|nr:MAG: hypothetical protein A3I66_00735 [Burkholderiales bacterium RIFCSPLOWO2_02_FULL_57_36]